MDLGQENCEIVFWNEEPISVEAPPFVDLKVAKSLKSLTETTILQQLNGFTKSNAELSFSQLVDRFLKAPHPWSKSTYDLNKYILTSHLHDKGLPTNPSSRATHIRHIN